MFLEGTVRQQGWAVAQTPVETPQPSLQTMLLIKGQSCCLQIYTAANMETGRLESTFVTAILMESDLSMCGRISPVKSNAYVEMQCNLCFLMKYEVIKKIHSE